MAIFELELIEKSSTDNVWLKGNGPVNEKDWMLISSSLMDIGDSISRLKLDYREICKNGEFAFELFLWVK